MNELQRSLELSASAMTAQSRRIRHISENIANADTPGYRRKIVTFAKEPTLGATSGTVRLGPVVLDRGTLKEVYDPAHPMADADGQYDGSNVDLIIEIADAREAQRSYEANLKMFSQARQMSKSLLELLRR